MRLMLWLKAVAILATVGSSLPPTYGAVPDDVGASWVLPSSAKPILEKVMPKMAEALALGWCDARIQRDAVEFVLGPSTASKTARNQRAATHRVTAVHPSKASQQGLIGRYIALEPRPGPISKKEMQTLLDVLQRADLSTLWTEVKPKPIEAPPAEEIEQPVGVNANFQRVGDLMKMGDDAEALKLLELPEKSLDATPFQRLRAAIYLKILGEDERARALVQHRKDPLLKALEDLVQGSTLTPNALLGHWE